MIHGRRASRLPPNSPRGVITMRSDELPNAKLVGRGPSREAAGRRRSTPSRCVGSVGRAEIDRVVEVGERGVRVDRRPAVLRQRRLRVDHVLRARSGCERRSRDGAARRVEQVEHRHDLLTVYLLMRCLLEIVANLGRRACGELRRDTEDEEGPRAWSTCAGQIETETNGLPLAIGFKNDVSARVGVGRLCQVRRPTTAASGGSGAPR